MLGGKSHEANIYMAPAMLRLKLGAYPRARIIKIVQ